MTRNIKVAIFRDGPFLPPHQGGSNSIYYMMKALMSKSVDVYLFRCYRGWDNYKLYKKEAFTTVFIKPEDYYHNKEILRRVISDLKIDICHFDNAEATVLQGKMVYDLSKICWEVHNVNHTLIDRLRGTKEEKEESIKLERNAAEFADVMLVRSDKDREDLTKIGISDEKIKLYKGSINPHLFKFRFKREGYNIVFIGNLKYKPNENAVKTIVNLIAPQVIRKTPQAKFVFVGPVNQELITSLLRPNITFTNEVINLNEIYASARIALCPVTEGSGTRIKILEYLAAGVPTISTNLGVEGLENKIKDCLVIEDNISNYGERIKYLIENPLESEAYSIKGRKYVEKHRSWDKNVKNIIDIYLGILT